MACNKVIVIVEITLYRKDTVMSDIHHVYVDYETNNLVKIHDLEYLETDDDLCYYHINEPIFGINFITEVKTNQLLSQDETLIDFLISDISQYNDCSIGNLIEDVKVFYTEEKENDFTEIRKFVTIFEECSYWDSYTGDGDYYVNYLKLPVSIVID